MWLELSYNELKLLSHALNGTRLRDYTEKQIELLPTVGRKLAECLADNTPKPTLTLKPTPKMEPIGYKPFDSPERRALNEVYRALITSPVGLPSDIVRPVEGP